MRGKRVQRTVYLDESGDLGFGAGSSRYLVICFLSVSHKHSLLRAVRRTKQSLRLPASVELKGNRLAWAQRRRVLEAVASVDLSVHAIVVNRDGVRPHLRANPNVLYNYALQFPLVEHIKDEALNEVHLVIDQRTQKIVGGGWELDHYLRVKLIAEEGLDLTLKCHHLSSRNALGVQAADVVANAIWRKHERGQAWGYNVIAAKIRDQRRLYFGSAP